ncbi:MAG: GNAT family acetyltransferase [Candidatus Nanopelagicales bacterium]
MLIDRCRPTDIAAVIELWHRCALTRAWNDPRRDIERKLADSPWGMLVGREHDLVIAAVMVGYDGHRGSVNYLAVDPPWRGHGIGSQLMDRCEADLRSRGCPKINLMVRGDNEAVARFYEQRGYRAISATEAVGFGLRLIPD